MPQDLRIAQQFYGEFGKNSNPKNSDSNFNFQSKFIGKLYNIITL